jgi:hypothetical protein
MSVWMLIITLVSLDGSTSAITIANSGTVENNTESACRTAGAEMVQQYYDQLGQNVAIFWDCKAVSVKEFGKAYIRPI